MRSLRRRTGLHPRGYPQTHFTGEWCVANSVTMAAITEAVKAHGLREQDVQTQSFNIWPRHEFPEVASSEVRTRRQLLVGYTVNNAAGIRNRDVWAVSEIIHYVAAAGGDPDHWYRLQHRGPYTVHVELRQDAVRDALAKAEHHAELTGIAVGDLIFIGEVGQGRLWLEALRAKRSWRGPPSTRRPPSGSGS